MHSIKAVLLLALLGLAARAQDKPPVQPPASAPAPAPPASPYVGSEACGTCHEDIAKAFAQTPHHVVDLKDPKRGFDGRACESCHGPGAKHAESASAADIRNPGKLNAAAIDRICLSCHLNEPTHVGRLTSSHAKDLVSCTTCHKIHATGTQQLVVRKTEAINKLCEGCHLAWPPSSRSRFTTRYPRMR